MASLLERIRKAGTGAARDDMRESVLENVRNICSSRLGHALACPTYGMPDVAPTRMPEGAAALAKALQSALAAFEPRLQRVQVSQVEEPDGKLRFEITGTLVGRRGSMTMRTQLGPGASALTVE